MKIFIFFFNMVRIVLPALEIERKNMPHRFMQGAAIIKSECFGFFPKYIVKEAFGAPHKVLQIIYNLIFSYNVSAG